MAGKEIQGFSLGDAQTEVPGELTRILQRLGDGDRRLPATQGRAASSQRWQEVKRVFHLAADRGPQERLEVLEAACAGDGGLRAEVEALLAFDAKASGFIKPRPFPSAPSPGSADMPTGKRVARYRIKRVIGRGGIGIVYEAE